MESRETTSNTGSGTNKNTRILIVDDSRTQLELLRYLLEMQEYSVSTASNGKEALDVAAQHHPNLIISDIVMPVMDGYEMCNKLKDDATLCQIPVILLTQLSDPEDIVRGLKARADYYFTKPYKPDYLLSKVKTVLENPLRLSEQDFPAGLEVSLAGKSYVATADRQQMLNLLFSTYESAVQQNRELVSTQLELKTTNEQLQRQTQQLQISETNFRALLESNADAMIVVDQNGIVRFANPAAQSLFHRGDDEFLDTIFEFPTVTGDTREVEIKEQNGESIIAELRVMDTYWEGHPAHLASLRDITKRKQYEQQIQEQQEKLRAANARLEALATCDSLTGLKNHRAFVDRLTEEFNRAARYGTTLSLILLDVDSFKKYNDTYGHPDGDEVLKMVARLLEEQARDADLVARNGGEEFAIILPSTNEEESHIAAERFRHAIEAAPWPQRAITASFGIATIAPNSTDTRVLMAQANQLISDTDKALYQSKAQGRNRVTHAATHIVNSS